MQLTFKKQSYKSAYLTLEYHNFFINKRANLLTNIMLSNIVELFMHFWTELRGVKRVTVRGDITVFRGTFKFDNFYSYYHIEAYQVNFSSFSRFEFRTSVCPTP